MQKQSGTRISDEGCCPIRSQKSGRHHTGIHVKTTLNLDDRCPRAAETGKTLTRSIENALRDHLANPGTESQDFRLQLLVKHGTPVPGVTVDDRDAPYELMEGRSRSPSTPICGSQMPTAIPPGSWVRPPRRNPRSAPLRKPWPSCGDARTLPMATT